MSISGRCRQLQDVFAVFAARRSAMMTSHARRTEIHFLIAFSHTGHEKPLRVWVLALVPSPSRVNIVCLIDFPRTSTSATVDTDALGNCTRNTERDTDKDCMRTVRRPSTLHAGLVLILVLDLDSESLMRRAVEHVRRWVAQRSVVLNPLPSGRRGRRAPCDASPQTIAFGTRLHNRLPRTRALNLKCASGVPSLPTPSSSSSRNPREASLAAASFLTSSSRASVVRRCPASLLSSPLLDDVRMGARCG
jgi:hypothetical protein